MNSRKSYVVIAISVIVLSILVGLGVPLMSGNSPSFGVGDVPWTPPATLVAEVQTATALPSATLPPAAPTSTPLALPSATARPVATSEPSLTPTDMAGVTPTLVQEVAPTETLEATTTMTVSLPVSATLPAAPQTAAFAQIAVRVANLRSGPETSSPVLKGASAGETYTITARSPDSAWWEICCVGNQPAWVSSSVVTVTGTVNAVPVRQGEH